jgi:hypothetical protein
VIVKTPWAVEACLHAKHTVIRAIWKLQILVSGAPHTFAAIMTEFWRND